MIKFLGVDYAPGRNLSMLTCKQIRCFTFDRFCKNDAEAQLKLEAIYTGDISPKFLYSRYRVENPGKSWLTLHIAIKEMDKRVYQTFVV